MPTGMASERPSAHPVKIGDLVASGVVVGKSIKRVDAAFPEAAGSSKGTWNVAVLFHVLKDGKTSHLVVLNSPGPAFNQAAIDAVKRWTFEPSLFEGEPVEVELEAVVNFTSD